MLIVSNNHVEYEQNSPSKDKLEHNEHFSSFKEIDFF